MHGGTVEELLNNAHSAFCGCQHVSRNIHIDFGDLENIDDEPLVEANLTFLNEIREVNGYIFLYIPAVDQISLSKLRLIQGRESIPGAPGIARKDLNWCPTHNRM